MWKRTHHAGWTLMMIMLVVAVLLAACGSKSDNAGAGSSSAAPKPSASSNQASSSKPKAETKTLRIGNIYNENHPTGMAALKFAELVKEKTGGEIEIVHFPSEQLGSEAEMVEGVNIGAIDMTITGTGVAGNFLKEYQIFPLVYIAKDMEHLNRILQGELGQELSQKFLDKTGSRVLASNWIREPRVLFGKKPVNTLEDLKGFRIRVPEQPVWIKSWERLGASPTPIALGELYSSIEMGIVDGAETGISYYSTNGFQNVAPYVMMTNHVLESNLILINEGLFQKLTPEQQKALTEAANEAGEYHIRMVQQSVDEQVKKLQSEGVTIIEVDRDKWREKADGLGLELENIWGEGLYAKFKSYE